MPERKSRFLILRLSSIGDIALTTPVLDQLLADYGPKSVDYIIKKTYKPLIESHPAIRKIYCLEDYPSLLALRRKIRGKHYHRILDLHKNIRSIFLTRGFPQVSRIKKGIFKRFLLTKFKIYKPPYLHVTQKYLKVLECETPSIPSSFLYLPSETCIQEKNKEIYTVLKTSQKSLILAPGASKPSKMLPFETWEKVIDDVYRKFEKIVIIGNGAEESEWARKMSQEGKSETIIDLTGRLSLCELMLFISQGIIFVGNDSGPAHLAAMLGLKTLVIFGQTVPEYGFTPLNSPILIEPPSHLLCRPCGHLGHDVCPKKHHLCMQSIDAESIICEIYYVLQTNEDIKNTHENRVY